MSAPFPTNYEVQWETWYSDSKDPIGNDIDKWHDPEPRLVIGWTNRAAVDSNGVSQAEDTNHLRLQVPPDFAWAAKDLATVPGRGKFQVAGAVDGNAGFHGWRPGLVLEMTRREG